MSQQQFDEPEGSRNIPQVNDPISAKPENGSSIAIESLKQKEQETEMAFASVHPIDTLLVQQLENIINGEKALRARYTSIDGTANTPEMRMAFSQELSDLKDRADRLYRFMNAMDFYGSYDPNTEVSHLPALV